MISLIDKKIVQNIAKKYKVRRVYLFGSQIQNSSRKPKDIDLAVEGVAPEQFFLFYTELYDRLSQPVDLIDLEQKSLFSRLVKKEGVLLYGQPQSARRR